MLNQKVLDEAGRIAALERYEILDTSPEKPFDKITSLVQNVLRVPICAVSLVDRERQWFKSIQGLDAKETPRSDSFCSHTIKTTKALVISDALEDHRFSTNPLVLGAPGIRSYAGVPLRTPDGYNVGALCVIDTEPRQFDEAQLAILRSFASLVVDELELRRIAERDHLTGALTRRGFIHQMEQEMARSKRYHRDAVLLILDVDHFKSVNDQYGHPAGDKVLKAVTDTCHQQLRANDSFGRLGGEEFAILLVETDKAVASVVADKFRQSIQGLVVDVGVDISVTASFGLAPLTFEASKPEDWIAQADEALYFAKKQGRNRCVSAGEKSEFIAA